MLNCFIYWDKGIEKMPHMIKYIYEHNQYISLKYNFNLVLITDNNVKKYIGLHNKFSKLTPKFKSYIIRFYLLHKYGGIWLDTDVIILKNLNEIYNNFLESKYMCMLDSDSNKTIGCASIFMKKNTVCSEFCVNFVNNYLDSNKLLNCECIGSNIVTKLYHKYRESIKLNTYDIVKNGCNFISHNDNPGYKKEKWIMNQKYANTKSSIIYSNKNCYYVITWSIYHKNNIKDNINNFIFNNKMSVFYYLLNNCKKEESKIEKNIIKILTSKNLDTCGLMLKSLLKLLNLESIIIHELDLKCDKDENLYIIIYNDRKTYKMPKNYIFWQIEQTSKVESPIVKFDKKYYTDMKNALMILDFSSYNIIFYKDKIDYKYIYINPFPFYDLYQYSSESEYLYDIIFFGAKSSRRINILDKLKNECGHKYRLKYLFGVIGNERDEYLKKSKYVLNIHYYENALLETERFNISLNTDCLIISENTLYEDDYNKEIYSDCVTYFDDFEDLKKIIEYNLQDDVFKIKKSKLKTSKKRIQDNSLFHLHKNIITIPHIQKLINYDISFNIKSDIYCITLIENNFRYKEIIKNKNIPPHTIFPAFKYIKGYIGCAMSYRTIFYNCKNQNIDKITIFEDDCIFNDNFLEIYNISISFLTKIKKWDICNFFCCIVEENQIVDVYNYKGYYFLKLNNMTGMVCNIYNNSIYDYFIDYPFIESTHNNNNYNTKYHIDRRLKNKDDLTIIIPFPYITNILKAESTLNMHNNKLNKYFEYNWFIKELNKSILVINNYISNYIINSIKKSWKNNTKFFIISLKNMMKIIKK